MTEVAVLLLLVVILKPRMNKQLNMIKECATVYDFIESRWLEELARRLKVVCGKLKSSARRSRWC